MRKIKLFINPNQKQLDSFTREVKEIVTIAATETDNGPRCLFVLYEEYML